MTLDAERAERVAGIDAGITALCDRFGLDYWLGVDRDFRFADEFWADLVKEGWLGLNVPESFGGRGGGLVELCAEVRALSRGGAGLGLLPLLSAVFGAIPVTRHGTPEQQAALLPGIATGDLLFCLGLTEPEAGSNSFNLATRAVRDGGDFVVNGVKHWISAVERSSHMLLACRTSPLDPADPAHGVTLLLVDLPAKGLRTESMDKLGMRYVLSNRVFLEDVRVPAANVLGEVDQGMKILFSVLNPERIVAAAGAIGSGELSVRLAVEHANRRAPFGTPIGAYQGISFPLAQAHAQLTAAAALTDRTAERYDRGERVGADATIAKLLAAQAADKAAERAFQTLGGQAYGREQHVERIWRDVKLTRIAPISEELSLAHIAQHALGLPRGH